MRKIKNMIYVCILLALLLSAYAFFIEPYRFVIQKQNIIVEKNSSTTLNIVQLSDIEIGTYYKEGNLEKQVDKINELSADIIVFTGDLFNNYAKYGPYQEISDILSSLKATYGKFAVYGNKDYGGGAIRVYEQLMKDAGFILLHNEVRMITVQDKKVQLIGTDSYLMGQYDENKIQQQLSQSDITIVLAHEPEIINQITIPYDLMLCGHTHGGQVNIPILPSLFHISNTPYQKGLYKHKQAFVYVDSGMGTSRLPIRFLNPPQISYLTLQI